jgi:hypothetical protein
VAEAFRTFAVDPPYAAQTLRKRLLDMRAELAAQVAEGYAKDWADYCRRIGVIEGIAIAVGVCEEFMKQEKN